jgi:hypothetical protein
VGEVRARVLVIPRASLNAHLLKELLPDNDALTALNAKPDWRPPAARV